MRVRVRVRVRARVRVRVRVRVWVRVRRAAEVSELSALQVPPRRRAHLVKVRVRG